ncbi:MAG: sulfatase-like hydrolase/transferase [Dehalococcoidia bacterium]|jgi:arylsulfatase A-like enzyme|nr:sulfatase-like hydrolase/transferase [Dehalococcoidia bacterium]
MASTDPDRPNILFILSDDQGPWAMNCAGTPELVTPNLDRLAATGTRFENFFCASPVCSPARASILTGQMPSQHGVQDFLRAGNSTELPEDGKRIQYLEGRTTYTGILAAGGYDCGLSGKWHLGDSVAPQAGFSYWDVHATGSGNYYNAPMFRDGEPYTADGYVSDVITGNALGYLESRLGSANPFSLNVHYTAPHAPWDRYHHPVELYDDYFNNGKFESVRWDPIHPNHLAKEGSSGSVGRTGGERRALLSGYFAAITAMDANIGRLVDWLEAQGLRENTLIVFTADNGMNMGHYGIWGKGNGTYPPNMFDTAVKVPTLVSRPGHVPEGVLATDLLSHYDLMPTLLEYAGLSGADSGGASSGGTGELPGRSFVPLLRGEPMDANRPVVVFEEYGPTRMIRNETAKYVHRHPEGPNEFFDLVGDPDETVNEIDNPAFAEAIGGMRAELQEWFNRYTEPERDGLRQVVKGRGQLDLVAGGESDPFAQDVVFLRDQ